MPTILTPTPTPYSTVSAPAAGDPRTAASVSGPLQTLLNNVADATDRVEALEDAPCCVRYAVSGASIAVNTAFTLSELFSNGGTFTLAANVITFPRTGIYLVTVAASLTCDDASDTIRINTDLFDPAQGASLITLYGWRPDALVGSAAPVNGALLIDVQDTVNNTLSFRAKNSSDLLSIVSGSTLSIVRYMGT